MKALSLVARAAFLLPALLFALSGGSETKLALNSGFPPLVLFTAGAVSVILAIIAYYSEDPWIRRKEVNLIARVFFGVIGGALEEIARFFGALKWSEFSNFGQGLILLTVFLWIAHLRKEFSNPTSRILYLTALALVGVTVVGITQTYGFVAAIIVHVTINTVVNVATLKK